MKAITISGKILVSSGKVLTKAQPFGLYQAEQWDAVALYEHIKTCLEDGVAAHPNTLTDEQTESVHYRPFGDITTLLIPLGEFELANNAANKKLIGDTLLNVSIDNPLLCYNSHDALMYYEPEEAAEHVPAGQSYLTFYRLYHGVNYVYDSNETQITGVWLYAPTDTARASARTQTEAAVAEAKAAVAEHTADKYGSGLTPRTVNTTGKRRDVTKILHDWIIERTHYAPYMSYDNTKTKQDYWCRTIFSPLVDDTYYPVCVGYASALSFLCQLFGINCVYVEGSTDTTLPNRIDHAWNMVSFELPVVAYPDAAAKWAAIDLTYDDGRQDTPARTDWFDYFCTAKTYHHNLSTPTVVTRVNSAKGYPVSVPTALCPYYGAGQEDLYDITKWTAPSGT